MDFQSAVNIDDDTDRKFLTKIAKLFNNKKLIEFTILESDTAKSLVDSGFGEWKISSGINADGKTYHTVTFEAY